MEICERLVSISRLEVWLSSLSSYTIGHDHVYQARNKMINYAISSFFVFLYEKYQKGPLDKHDLLSLLVLFYCYEFAQPLTPCVVEKQQTQVNSYKSRAIFLSSKGIDRTITARPIILFIPSNVTSELSSTSITISPMTSRLLNPQSTTSTTKTSSSPHACFLHTSFSTLSYSRLLVL